MSPRSSVTVGHSWVGSGERWFGVGGRGRAGRRSGRRSRRRARSTARRVACGSRRGAARSSSATAGSSLDERVADDPGAVAVGGRGGPVGLGVAGRPSSRPRSTTVERAVRPRQRLLDVRLGVAHQLGEERQGVPGDAPDRGRARRSTVGHRRDRRADEAALPARRAVDELLELGPAVRLARRCPCRTGGPASRP